MTEAIVLAAGLGNRLRSASTQPKWLTPVGDGCPADAQLAGIADAGVDVIRVVAPADPSVIIDYVEPWRDRLFIDIVANDHSDDWNNWYSLLLGLRAADRPDDVLVVNSDLFAHRVWFAALTRDLLASPAPAALAIDPDRGRTDEAMKVGMNDSGELIDTIGKVGVSRPAGEYVGMARLTRPAVTELQGVFEGFIGDESRVNNWYEHGFQVHMSERGGYAAVAVPPGGWVEIDDPDDLVEAERLAEVVDHSSP